MAKAKKTTAKKTTSTRKTASARMASTAAPNWASGAALKKATGRYLGKVKLNSLLTINMVVSGLFGLGFMFAPEAMLAPYGIPADQAAASATMSRLFGASNFGYAILFWFIRGTTTGAAKTAVVKAFSLAFGVGFVISFVEQMSGTIGPLGWTTVALYGILAAAYAYFGYGKGANR